MSGGRGQLLRRLHDLAAVHVPEVEIEQHEPDAPFAENRQTVGAGMGPHDIVAAPRQDLGQEGRDLGLIVQDQDTFWVHWGCFYGIPKAFPVLQFLYGACFPGG